jgi:hypothetical protein
MPRIALAERRHEERSTIAGIGIASPETRAVSVAFVDSWMVGYCETFVPDFCDDPQAYAPRIYVPNKAKTGWTRLAKRRPNLDALECMRALVNAGRFQEPQTIAGVRRDVPVIGIQFRKDDRVAYTNLDLDGKKDGPKPSEVIDFLSTLGIEFIVTCGSGTAGKYRVLIRHTRSHAIVELHKLWKGIFAANGWRVEKGSIEIFPSTTNGRLPFGYGACKVFDRRDLTQSRELPFEEILTTFQMSEACDLDELRASVDAVKTNQVEHEPSECFVIGNYSGIDTGLASDNENQTRTQPSKRKGRPRELTPRERADVERYRTQGVEPDERFVRAIPLLYRDARNRGLTNEQTREVLAQWVRDGKIARSNFAKRYGAEYITKQIADLPRQITNLSKLYDKQTRRAFNLSARDIMNLAPIVERVAAQLGITQEYAGNYALRMLPRWKGYPDAIRIVHGILVHSMLWKEAGGNDKYAAIRDAFGLWRKTSKYLPQHRAANGKGESTHWACDFVFDESSPGRALGRTWKQALKVAKSRQDKPSTKPRRTSATTKQRSAKKTNDSK